MAKPKPVLNPGEFEYLAGMYLLMIAITAAIISYPFPLPHMIPDRFLGVVSACFGLIAIGFHAISKYIRESE